MLRGRGRGAGHLLREADNDQVLGLSAGFSANSIWIGATDLAGEALDGRWRPRTYENWRTAGGEPNGGTVENCAEPPPGRRVVRLCRVLERRTVRGRRTHGRLCVPDRCRGHRRCGAVAHRGWRNRTPVRRAPYPRPDLVERTRRPRTSGHLVTLTSPRGHVGVRDLPHRLGSVDDRRGLPAVRTSACTRQGVPLSGSRASRRLLQLGVGRPNGAGPDDVGSFYNRSRRRGRLVRRGLHQHRRALHRRVDEPERHRPHLRHRRARDRCRRRPHLLRLRPGCGRQPLQRYRHRELRRRAAQRCARHRRDPDLHRHAARRRGRRRSAPRVPRPWPRARPARRGWRRASPRTACTPSIPTAAGAWRLSRSAT